MGNFDFILDNMRFSFSSASSYHTCAYGFNLTYVEAEDRANNFFADFGLLCHQTLEEYFRGELKIEELPQYYMDNWTEFVKSPCPPYPQGMEENYYNQGLSFFENFKFNKDDYEIVYIEEKIDATYHGINLVVKPDLILREKATEKCILIDYKTAKIKATKALKAKQLEDYLKQFLLYVNFLWWERGVKVDEIQIWFLRDQKVEIIPVDPYKVGEVLTWFEDTVSSIKKEDEWKPNLDKGNEYFCFNICSVRSICKYRN